MSFAWPWALAALLLVPLLLGLLWWLRRRRRRAAVTVSSLALVRSAAPAQGSWRRRVPAALLLLGLLVLGVGVARPQASVLVPSNSSTILLALDVSASMCTTDVDPNRLAAAEKEVSSFVGSQAGGPRIGLVAFAGTAGVLVPPTTDTQRLLDALKGLTTARGTAIGQAILTSIDAISQVDPSVAPTGVEVTPQQGQSTPGPTGPGQGATPPSGTGGAGEPGDWAPDAIVVLTDGANTQGVDPLEAAAQAAARRVRIFTIGFGTTQPAPMRCEGSQVENWYGGYSGGGGRAARAQAIDEQSLTDIAQVTGGQYYRAEDAGQLHSALSQLPGQFALVRQDADLAPWFAAAAGALLAAAVALSLWLNRPRPRR